MPISNSSSSNDIESTSIKVKIPKRILHFSDGVLEEYSDDENITPPNEQTNTAIVDVNTLSWSSWIVYKTWKAGTVALSVCDYLGENLAYFFGISTPKYWAEIEEYKRMQTEEAERQKKAEGWSVPTNRGDIALQEITTNQPVATTC